jgi:hypothetical protein
VFIAHVRASSFFGLSDGVPKKEKTRSGSAVAGLEILES